MRQFRRDFEPAFSRRIGKILSENLVKFRGKNAETLKGILEISKNFQIVLM